MKVVSVWSPKGGAGKSTIALHLAGAAVWEGLSPLLCDLDPQKSARWVAGRGKLPYSVSEGFPKEQPKEELVILDHPPATDVAPPASVVVVPIRASALDYSSAQDAIGLLEGKTVIRVVNAVDLRRKEERQVAQILQKEGALIVRDRSIFPRVIGRGQTAFNANILDSLYGAREARRELLLIFARVMEALNGK
jgi:chromosome partitioning protein